MKNLNFRVVLGIYICLVPLAMTMLLLAGCPKTETNVIATSESEAGSGSRSDAGAASDSETGDLGSSTNTSAKPADPAKPDVEVQVMRIESPAFGSGEPIPVKYTEVNPPIKIEYVPPETKSLVLIMEDPDAPAGVWDHWILYNIPPDAVVISEGETPKLAMVGKNSWGRMDYGGPAPPEGTHKYVFTVYALDDVLPAQPGLTKVELIKVMQPHVVSEATLVGMYTATTSSG